MVASPDVSTVSGSGVQHSLARFKIAQRSNPDYAKVLDVSSVCCHEPCAVKHY